MQNFLNAMSSKKAPKQQMSSKEVSTRRQMPKSAPIQDTSGFLSLADVAPALLDGVPPDPVLEVGLEIFCGESPYDHLRMMKQGQEGGAAVVCLTHEELHSVWRAQAYGNPADAAAHLASIGLERAGHLLGRVFSDRFVAERTAFSLECCEAVTCVAAAHLATLRTFTYALLQRGVNVAIADFALDVANALFEGRLPPLFASVAQDVNGRITLNFNADVLAEAPNGQISMLGNLAEAGQTTINTMSSTRRPVLHPAAAPVLRVLAIARDAGRPSPEETVAVDRLTGRWMPGPGAGEHQLVGSPMVIVLDTESDAYKTTGWTGNVLLFGAHFSEIQNVGGVSEDTLCEMVEQRYGEERSRALKAELCSNRGAAKEALLQRNAYECVSMAPQSKVNYTKSRKF
eukprot:TRINITY_DN10331_c0_g1_i1.p1 TRINITY_DN10331_c0_g1~~TRINITY_DN10331_c0_g1_i1.p1  ORF type:complete len:401 (+),score=113.54 TRINITY_DN10331_c0_g1_i1:44-1246(+)